LEACHRLVPIERQKENKWKTRRFPPKYMEVDRMNKISKQKFVVLIALSAVVLTSVYASIIPSAHAATVATTEDKAVSILNAVVGLNTSAYAAAVTSDTNAIAYSLPREDLTLSLFTSQSSLRARCSFINGNLNQFYFSDYVGSPSLNQPTTTNTIVMAQGFLQRYQNYTHNPLYSDLTAILDKVDTSKNVTKTVGNLRLEMSVFGNQTEQDFIWSYVDANGIPALSKNVVLSYHNGHLESFIDNWQLYSIKGVPTLSVKDAIALALQATADYSYTTQDDSGNNLTVKDFTVKTIFNTTLSYANYLEDTKTVSTRSGDPYTLYPSWYIGVGFDKVYPGQVTGLSVRIWADTGNVSLVEPIIVRMTPKTSDTTPLSNDMPFTILLILLPTSIITATSISAVSLYCNKSKLPVFKHCRKMSLSKRKVSALCLILLPLTLIAVTPIAAATDFKAEIYIPQAAYPTASWIPGEISTAHAVGEAVQGYFTNAGFDSGEYEYSKNNYNTAHNDIIYNIMWDEYYYSEASMLYMGNGGDGGMSLSENGLNITAIEIRDNTYDNTITFAWMWMCAGAGHYYNSPNNFDFAYAWTQTDLSDAPDGFNSPDDNGHAFIGFKGEAPFISQYSFRWYTQAAYPFIEYFYQAATTGYSVHDALNLASEAVFNVPYNSSPLNQGYQAYWPGGFGHDEGWYAGKMVVFGDSNAHIGAGTYQTVSAPYINGTDTGTINTSYQFGFSSATSDNSNVRYLIFWGDGSDPTLTGLSGSGSTQQVSHSYDHSDQYTIVAYAISAQGVWSGSSTYDVAISGPPVWLTVNAYDAYLGEGSPSTTAVYVDGDYVGTVGTSPVSIQVSNGYHTVTVDYRAYNIGWGGYETIYEITGDYDGYYNIYSETPVDIHIVATYDTTINAVYSMG
jgi:hypothetical protein